MDLLYKILLVVHLIGWAMVLGGVLTRFKNPGVPAGALHGALTALVTGVAMVGLASADVVDEDLDSTKIAVKLVILLVVLGLVVVGRRRPERVTVGWLGAIAGLVVTNVAIAVIW